MPLRSLVVLGVAGALLALAVWAAGALVRRGWRKIAVAAVTALVLALIAWMIVIWPAYWD
jgi:hypothetical protein